MAKTFTLTTAALALLCVSNALAIPISIDISRIPPSLPDDKIVRKNFDFLVGLIHNNPKWVTKILVQIKKEMLLRGKLTARSGLKCASCIFQIQYNLSDTADAESFNDQQHQAGDPHLWNEVLADAADGTLQQPPRILNQIFRRSRRSLSSKLRRSNESQGSNTTTPATPSALPDVPVRNRPINLTTPRPPRPNSTATTTHTTTRAPTTPSTTRPPSDNRFGKLAEKDSLGRAILRCDEESERTYCLHNGKCLIVKILELKSCSCPTGFRGLRCQDFDVVQTIETIDRHADIRSFEEISDEEERGKMISSIAATAYYTVNTFLTE